MVEKRAVSYTLILILVVALASSSTLLGVKRASADSVIKTITVGTGPYGDVFDPDNCEGYEAHYYNRIKIKNGFLDVRRRGSR